MKKLLLFSLLLHLIFYFILTLKLSMNVRLPKNETILLGQLVTMEEKNEKKVSALPKKNKIAANKTSGKVSKPKTANNHLEEKIYLQLVKILHEAIVKNQIYPETAAALQQKGQVQVAFSLFPDGHLEQIQIKKSSGFHTLDLAALESVQSIQPMREAKQFLKKAEKFKVEIIYDAA